MTGRPRLEMTCGGCGATLTATGDQALMRKTADAFRSEHGACAARAVERRDWLHRRLDPLLPAEATNLQNGSW